MLIAFALREWLPEQRLSPRGQFSKNLDRRTARYGFDTDTFYLSPLSITMVWSA
jgi:hypothetical protein